jgi:hypothetical protein
MRRDENLLAYVAAQYGALSPKARRILHVLVDDGSGMTRNEIAAGLWQPRLYAHDLKLLDHLEQARFIGAERRRRHHLEMDRNPEYRFMVENYREIYGGSMKHLRWGKFDYIWEYYVNGNMYGVLRKIIKNARKHGIA